MFRREALEGAATRLHGRIILPAHLGHHLLTALYGSVAVAIVLILAFGSVTKKAVLQGAVMPAGGVVRIVAPATGIIVSDGIAQGERVRRGAALFHILSAQRDMDEQNPNANVGRLLIDRRASLQQDRERLLRLTTEKDAALGRRVTEFKAEELQIEDQIALQRSRVRLLEDSLKRTQNLVAANFLSPAQADTQLAQLIEQKQRLTELLRARSQTQREQAEGLAERTQLQIQAQRDEASISRSISSLEQETEENRSRKGASVVSPLDGVLATLMVSPGQHVTAGTVVAAMVGTDITFEAELYAPSRSVGFLQPGLPVLLRYQSFPHQKFGQYRGKILDVATTALRPEDYQANGLPAPASADMLYRVRVTLESQAVQAYGKSAPLQAGMALEATVVLEDRKIYEWILDPIFSMTGRL
ncbi:membrane fusion protein [Roseateles sp. YR242]|uniref:HlyD family secretion protein n=1 Tax=Roseateles sp. YR242 TaxID=1855305 RepID=UPI0008B97BBF|nr:HlyD family efflux transporter periplasmic adaptor subunit [Roseateles sp. YR242]SEK31816.1 membrane fusion protein [Roseateles sp. YR242]